jgi:hypothetical protein
MLPARIAVITILIFAPLAAWAHGFAQRYDLPVPLGLYLTGAAAAVVLSFVILAWRRSADVTRYPTFDLLRTRFGRMLVHPVTLGVVRAISVGLFCLVIVAGLIGDPNPFKNFAPTMVWVIWWVGFAYIAGLIGNLWSVVNPWMAIFDVVESVYGRIAGPAKFGLHCRYPQRLGDWPAVTLLMWFVWAELVWPSSDAPAALAQAAIVYSLITWAGMFTFGKTAWLRHGEVFSIVFELLAKFSPTEYRCASDREPPRLNLRPWAVGLLVDEPVSVSRMVFVIVMLASVTFDGLLATPLWASIAEWMLYSDLLRPAVLLIQDIAGHAIAAVATIALLVFVAGFLCLYLLFSALMRAMMPESVRERHSVSAIARTFVLSLIPISLAYHLAHYLSYLLIVGQYMIPLASDPFGFGWNLFGTSRYMVNIGIVNARFVWITSVIAIVVGHIIAVFLAHVTARRLLRDNRSVLRSQIPMLVLMVGYTMISLWILAQPLVEVD